MLPHPVLPIQTLEVASYIITMLWTSCNRRYDFYLVVGSWGPEDDGKTVDGPHKLARRALMWGSRYGRAGRGAIYVVASGNGGDRDDDCNYDGYANSIYTVSNMPMAHTQV